MFAGAAREAVFSNPEVIRRVNAGFVPVALKAALVNRPPDDEEGRLYQEIERSKPAPQGICVVNSAGKVLSWTLMFDDDRSVLAFLDHARERFAGNPDAAKPVVAEVYQKFPSQKRRDVADSGKVLPVLDRHPAGKHCPAEPPLRQGTVAVRLFGRALDRDGKPVADTRRQESYVEDRFTIEVETQEALAGALAGAGEGPVPVPLEVARQWVKQAYLGVLDVQPLDNPIGTSGELKKCEFRLARDGTVEGRTQWRVTGESEVFIDRMANAGPGDLHEVKLAWDGFLEMDGNRMARLVLAAAGREKLRFNSARGHLENEVALLPGGHRVELDCGVRFGLLGEPAGPDRVAADALVPAPAALPPAGPQPEPPGEALRQLAEVFGPPFLVFQERVQAELRLSPEQKEKVRKRLQATVPEAVQALQRLGGQGGEEREKALQSHREKLEAGLRGFLEGLLEEEQLKRLHQLELQQEGPFALLARPEVGQELQITAEQRRQFMTLIQEMEMKIAPLVRELQSGGNPGEIGPKIMKVRKEQEGRVEAVLTEAQKKQWKEMLGKPLVSGP